MQKRFLLVGCLLVISCAIVDCLTHWSINSSILLGILLALGILLIGFERRSPKFVILTALATVCLGLHLITLARIENVARRWDTIGQFETDRAIRTCRRFVVSTATDLLATAGRIAENPRIADAFTSDRRSLFDLLSDLRSRSTLPQQGGFALADSAGEIISWTGRIPNSLGSIDQVDSERVLLRRSSASAWFEAVAPVIDQPSMRKLGYAIAYLKVKHLFGSSEPEPGCLSAQLTRAVGYPVSFSSDAPKDSVGGDWIVSEVSMPQGQVLGYLTLRKPSPEQYIGRIRNKSLFVASLLTLLLMVGLFVAIVKWMSSARLRLISNTRLAAIVASIAGLRIGFAGLRDNLGLERFGVFSPLDYATQIATGILRSPADLALTGLAIVGAATIWILAVQNRGTRGLLWEHKASVSILLWSLLGAAGAALVVLTSRGLATIHSDIGPDLFLETAFTRFSIALVRVGLAGVAVGVVTLCGLLITEQMLLMKRRRFESLPVSAGLVTGFHFVLTLAITRGRLGYGALVISILSIGFGIILYQILRRQIKAGLTWIVTGVVIAAAFVEIPYGTYQHNRKSRIAAEAIASTIIYQTREWKSSIIEKASSEIESDLGLSALLANPQSAWQGIALNLWAKSVINRARVRGGIYVFSREDQIIDRFAPDEVGDISGIEAIIRSARLRMKRTTQIAEVSIGRETCLSYLSVIPFYDGLEYVGCVVVVIPERYDVPQHGSGLHKGLLSSYLQTGDQTVRSESATPKIDLTVIEEGKITASTSWDFEIGGSLDSEGLKGGEWFDYEPDGKSHRCYLVEPEGSDRKVLLSFRMPTLFEHLRYGMSCFASYLLVATAILVGMVLVQLIGRFGARKDESREPRRRLGFTQKIALAFVLVAIIPALILGSASRGFIKARLREVIESRAEEGLKLARMALERVSREDAERFAENPILMEALKVEPPLIVNLVKPGTSAVVFDSTAKVIAAYGNPSIPIQIVKDVIAGGKTYSFFSTDSGLTSKSVFPIRDVIKPSRIVGCAFVSRTIDDRLARKLAVEIDRQIDFFGIKSLVASSSKEYFELEAMGDRISPDAYRDCFLSGRDLCFSWHRLGGVDMVIAYAPLRDYDGTPVGAISTRLAFEKDVAGVQMESTLSTISHLIVIVLWTVFLFGSLLAKNISRPIKELIRGTMMVRAGNLDFEIPRQGDDEIADLVSSFNEMTQALYKSRRALNERKRYIETILANVGAGIISVDSRGRIEMVNPAAETLLGIKERNARHRDCVRFLSKIGASGLADVLKEVSDRRDPVVREVTIEGEDRRKRVFRAVGSAVRVGRDLIMGKVIVFEDLTDLIRAKQLVAWNEMARQVAHEIKNPLTPMKLSIQHLIQCHRDKVKNLDQVVEETARTVIDQIESLRRIAVEFSRFSRLPERNLEVTDINLIISDVLKQYDRIVGEKVKIETSLDQSLPWVRVDKEEIKRVLINIVENALDAMENGGRLRIATRRASFSQVQTHRFRVSTREEPVADRDRYVEIEISDTGAGIEEQSLSHIFEPNFSTKTKGAGLGLAICKGVIDAYDGEIVIETTPGAGTTVRIWLPSGSKELPRVRNRSNRRTPRHRQL